LRWNATSRFAGIGRVEQGRNVTVAQISIATIQPVDTAGGGRVSCAWPLAINKFEQTGCLSVFCREYRLDTLFVSGAAAKLAL
jgi:hypothetical protein